MSRPNTRKKLRGRILKLFQATDEPLVLAEVEESLIIEAAQRGYLPPDSYQIGRIVREFKDKGVLEIVMPFLPQGMDAYNNRELRVLEWKFTRYRIPTLNRLALLAGEDEDGVR